MNLLNYFVLGFALVLVILIIYLIIKQRDQMQRLNSSISEQNLKNQLFISELGRDLGDSFTDKFYYLNKSLDEGLHSSNETLNTNLNLNLKNIDEAFKEVAEKITKIETSAQVTIGIKDEISKLNSILSNQKLRGNFGEHQLKHILGLVYSDNINFYQFQKQLSNGKIADCVMSMPDGRNICIDSKFILKNYERICESKDEKEVKFYTNELTKDIKKQIIDIASKYIIPKETADFAILFIPSEAVFVFVCSKIKDILEFANENSIFLASPTTLMSLLYSLKILTKDERITQNAQMIKDEMGTLLTKFKIHIKHAEMLENYAAKVHNQAKILNENSKSMKESFDKFSTIG